ncbi:MAG: hypothetical protein L0H64_10855 [Pseudonocardia sp.]|nr:hypothetical protein [Pseudonocardia sp.]
MHGPEGDVPEDPKVANSRDVGGQERRDDERADPDGDSTTGVDRNEEFVGRVAGDDPGYAGETGAERRAR